MDRTVYLPGFMARVCITRADPVFFRAGLLQREKGFTET